MPKAKLVQFGSVDHEERRPGVVLSSLVDGSTGATQIPSGVAEFAVGASAPMHYHPDSKKPVFSAAVASQPLLSGIRLPTPISAIPEMRIATCASTILLEWSPTQVIDKVVNSNG